ncbi:nitronate monooxygenase [Clostridium sp. D2Q-11]|uniref:Probable nitronate monooxygenase n=1 Tax=Anaeromonas frigoriresistens TaxID=2683708 RepID=A0A942V3K3_9FIRM|nr:nitronate monooxygenase [Anaeromonas frigoriresistens]MBS4539297.1 nitronate monooxygenase [Anaeromonas frigoriresistens]
MNKVSKKFINELELPIISAPMFLISSPKMVIESCKAGIIGSFPLLNARTTDTLEEWMKDITMELEEYKNDNIDRKVAPWAVNIIVHKSNKRYKEDLKMIKKYKPPIVITSLGDPTPVIEAVHEYNGLVFSDVTKLVHAKKAANKGIDGLILVCSGAGGHGGALNPFAFIGEVKEFWNGLTILAGAISTGKDIIAANVLGADLVSIGTKFISTKESMANSKYQEMLINSNLDDILYTDAITGVNANFLIPSIKQAGIKIDELERKQSFDFSEENSTGSKAWKDIWSAGQGVGRIKETLPISQVISNLKKKYDKVVEESKK